MRLFNLVITHLVVVYFASYARNIIFINGFNLKRNHGYNTINVELVKLFLSLTFVGVILVSRIKKIDFDGPCHIQCAMYASFVAQYFLTTYD